MTSKTLCENCKIPIPEGDTLCTFGCEEWIQAGMSNPENREREYKRLIALRKDR